MDISPLLLASRQGRYRIASIRKLLLIVAALLGAAQAVEAQNAISNNAEFDTDYGGWYNLPNQTSAWEAEDADGCGQSGHFHADSTGPGPGGQSYALAAHPACLPVVVGDHVFQQVAYTSTHEILFYLWFYSDSACAIEAGDNFADASPFPPGPWGPAFRESIIPAGVASVRFVAGAFDLFGGAPSTGFDRAYLGLADRLFSDNFSGGSTCRWSSAVGAL